MMLTREYVLERLSYSPETGEFLWIRPGNNRMHMKRAGSVKRDGYRRIGFGKKTYAEHVLAWLIMTGDLPIHDIDHENRSRADNRWCNLRCANKMENGQNRTAVGVTYHKQAKRWQAQIGFGMKTHYIGLFTTREEAMEAYKAKKAELHTFAPEYQPV